ncbi:MAG: hypothetical protein KDB79_10465 [Acidobacteria bacterium]|nr:hypothetical protein [Acidobacteriota bacterium]
MKLFRSYKEIWFGGLLGVAMWLTDAVMHVELGVDVHAGSLSSEIFSPHSTTLIFRLLYMIIAVSFGVFLWRANWRERELRALEQSVVSFQRQLDAPALRILTSIRQLQNRNSVKLDETAEKLATDINNDANLIDELAKKYLEFSRLVQEGKRAEAIEILQAIEIKLAEQKLSIKT